MFGFIEKWLADILGIECELFVLNSGNEAVMLGRADLERVMLALRKLWEEDGDDRLLYPCIINSDVMGMKVILHKYWSNEEVLYGLTDGPTKASDGMICFANLSNPRFDFDSFPDRIMTAYNEIVRQQDGEDVGYTLTGSGTATVRPADTAGAIDVPLETEPEECEAEACPEEEVQPSQEDLFMKFFDENYKLYKTSCQDFISDDKEKLVRLIGSGPHPLYKTITRLADQLDKNIFVCSDKMRPSVFNPMKKRFKFSEISEHTIFLLINPSQHHGFRLPEVSVIENSSAICFGKEINNLYCLEASHVEDSISSDESLTEEERNKILHDLENNPSLSIYSKFDEVFKDTYTNVVWALRDRCFVYLTFKIGNPVNLATFGKCMSELGRRFGRKLSIYEMKQIDSEYQKEISEMDKDKYIEFAVSSSNEVIDEFKSQFDKEKESYTIKLAEAMEHGKLMQRFAEQIDAFDEEKFSRKQREKAISDYVETINIPGVLSISIKDKTVHVYTKNIYAQDERTEKWHDIGTFHIMIGMLSNSYSTSDTIRIMNTKHQINGMNSMMQAPHIFSNGTICHGSLATVMVEAYKRRNLFQMIYQLILFLEDANTDDAAGKYINNWPEVPEEVAKGELTFEDEKEIPNEAELKFDSMLAESIPIHLY